MLKLYCVNILCSCPALHTCQQFGGGLRKVYTVYLLEHDSSEPCSLKPDIYYQYLADFWRRVSMMHSAHVCLSIYVAS